MKAFIFAAGFGERLKPLTETIPKPLILVNGIPSICYSIASCRAAGINDLVINIHYKKDDIISFFDKNNNFDMNIDFSIEDEILGTGGGLKKCESVLTEPFLIMNSDVISDINVVKLIDSYEKSKFNSIIVLKGIDENINGTVSVMHDEVSDFKNALATGITPEYEYSGTALLDPEIFKFLEKEFSSVVYTGYTSLVEKKSLGYYVHKGFWQDIGTIDSLNYLNSHLKGNSLFDLMIKKYLPGKIII